MGVAVGLVMEAVARDEATAAVANRPPFTPRRRAKGNCYCSTVQRIGRNSWQRDKKLELDFNYLLGPGANSLLMNTYRPTKFGGRFSRNAATPSRWSSVWSSCGCTKAS